MKTRDACARAEPTVEERITVMIAKRVRHLRYQHRKKLVGLVKIGDLVKSRTADKEFIIEQLVDYVRG